MDCIHRVGDSISIPNHVGFRYACLTDCYNADLHRSLSGVPTVRRPFSFRVGQLSVASLSSSSGQEAYKSDVCLSVGGTFLCHLHTAPDSISLAVWGRLKAMDAEPQPRGTQLPLPRASHGMLSNRYRTRSTTGRWQPICLYQVTWFTLLANEKAV